MITYDLHCSSAHIFEGWFASSDAYNEQHSAGLISCPICGDGLVTKALSAPFVGRKGNQARRLKSNELSSAPLDVAKAASDSAASSDFQPALNSMEITNSQIPPSMMQLIEKIATVQAEILEKSQWVGRKFADEARAIHYGETQARQIHGEASLKEAEDLAEEGISIAAMPLPFIPPEAKN